MRTKIAAIILLLFALIALEITVSLIPSKKPFVVVAIFFSCVLAIIGIVFAIQNAIKNEQEND